MSNWEGTTCTIQVVRFQKQILSLWVIALQRVRVFLKRQHNEGDQQSQSISFSSRLQKAMARKIRSCSAITPLCRWQGLWSDYRIPWMMFYISWNCSKGNWSTSSHQKFHIWDTNPAGAGHESEWPSASLSTSRIGCKEVHWFGSPPLLGEIPAVSQIREKFLILGQLIKLNHQ